MEHNEFNKNKLINYWTQSSDEDFEVMNTLFESRKYNWALFVGHLMIEKLLKALYVKIKNEYPPYIHNLIRLAEKCNLELTDEQKLFFVTVTAFNINTRYDDYKMSFQKKSTPEYSAEWVDKITKNRQWIKKLILI